MLGFEGGWLREFSVLRRNGCVEDVPGLGSRDQIVVPAKLPDPAGAEGSSWVGNEAFLDRVGILDRSWL